MRQIVVQSGNIFGPSCRLADGEYVVGPAPMSIDEGMALLHETGFDGIDFNINNFLAAVQIKSGRVGGFFTLPEKDMLEILRPYKEAAKRYGLRFAQAHAPFPNYGPTPEMQDFVQEAVKTTIRLCDYLECPNLVVHGRTRPYEDGMMTREEEREANMAMYSSFIPVLKQYGVTCCLENLFLRHRGRKMEGFCADPHTACAYVDDLNALAGAECFGFCVDTGHINLLCMDLYSFIKSLGKRVKVLHVHDNDGLEDEHLFPYMGIIDWDRFCQALREIDYQGDLSFETFRALGLSDPALTPSLLRLLMDIGKLLRQKIDG